MKQKFILTHVFAAAICSILILLVYATVQQNYRGNANNPQVELTTDIANRLNRMASIEPFFTGDTIDLENSLGAFVVLYDATGQPLRSNAVFKGSAPQLPRGVFEFVQNNGEERVTWQPERGTRIAMVVRRESHGEIAFVAAGRSLRETEDKEKNLRKMIIATWVVCMGLIMAHAALQWFDQKWTEKKSSAFRHS